MDGLSSGVGGALRAGAVSAMLASLALVTAAWSAPDDAARFAGVVLEDPGARKWDLAALVGQPVLVVVADRSASTESVDWGRGIGKARPQSVALWVSTGTVAIVSIADLRAVPGFARGTARWIIARMVGEQGRGGPPLLLDWEGAVAARIDAQDGVPNVRLYAPDGALVLRDSGAATPEKIVKLAAAIDGLVGKPAIPSATVPAASTAVPPEERAGP